MGVHVSPILNTHPIPQGHPSAPALSTLSQASNLDWWSISHMIIYMFQCHSPKPSHPRPLPQSPKDCSIHLCLFCCLVWSSLRYWVNFPLSVSNLSEIIHNPSFLSFTYLQKHQMITKNIFIYITLIDPSNKSKRSEHWMNYIDE